MWSTYAIPRLHLVYKWTLLELTCLVSAFDYSPSVDMHPVVGWLSLMAILPKLLIKKGFSHLSKGILNAQIPKLFEIHNFGFVSVAQYNFYKCQQKH